MKNIHFVIDGQGPPLLLLHGFPETHRCWDNVVAELKDRFTIVRADLPGYGKSQAGNDASKRSMATSMLSLMYGLGYSQFAIAGHDRGGLVAARLALEHPEAVTALTILDIIPVLDMWESIKADGALGAYHLFLLAQPSPLPERLLRGAPKDFVDSFLDGWTYVHDAIDDEHRIMYHEAFNPTAVCADYRAGATVDLEHDRLDRAAGKRIKAPILILWQEPGGVTAPFNPIAIWQKWADKVEGYGLDAGHFLPEERPLEVAAALIGHSRGK